MKTMPKHDRIAKLVEAARVSITIGGPDDHGEFWIENSFGTRMMVSSRQEAAEKLEQHAAMKVLNDLVPRWREHDWHLYAHDAELMVRTIVSEDAEATEASRRLKLF